MERFHIFLVLHEVIECMIDLEFGTRKSFGGKIYAHTPQWTSYVVGGFSPKKVK
jgi:hypothetical protein